MQNQYVEELNNIFNSFDKNDIISYQLLLIKMHQISLSLQNEEINIEQKKQIIFSIENYLEQFNLKKFIEISDLNNLFNPQSENVDIYDKNIYLTLYGIILNEWESDENIFSFRMQQFISEIISMINENYFIANNIENNNIENNNMENNNMENNVFKRENEQKENFPEFDTEIHIVNKDYLKEYLIRKNILEYKCNCCGLSSWQNNPLILYLHSKNNIYSNQNLKNLEFLCPNCYSQLGE